VRPHFDFSTGGSIWSLALHPTLRPGPVFGSVDAALGLLRFPCPFSSRQRAATNRVRFPQPTLGSRAAARSRLFSKRFLSCASVLRLCRRICSTVSAIGFYGRRFSPQSSRESSRCRHPTPQFVSGSTLLFAFAFAASIPVQGASGIRRLLFHLGFFSRALCLRKSLESSLSRVFLNLSRYTILGSSTNKAEIFISLLLRWSCLGISECWLALVI
jgi:hypothetical protein